MPEITPEQKARLAAKEQEEARFLEVAANCVRDLYVRLGSLSANEAQHVYWGPSTSHANPAGERTKPANWTKETYPIEYSVRFIPAVQFAHWPECPKNGVYDLWLFMPGWEAKVFNKAFKAVRPRLATQTAISVNYADVSGKSLTVYGPGLGSQQLRQARRRKGAIIADML